MEELKQKYYTLRFSSLNNLLRLFTNDYTNYLTKENIILYEAYKLEQYTDFKITKCPNGKIMCTNKQISFTDISNFHESQIFMMKINFSSFSNFNWSNNMIIHISEEYINNMIINIINVLKNIIPKINNHNAQIVHHFDFINNAPINKTNTTIYDNYCVENIRYLLHQSQITIVKLKKMNIIIQLFDFIYVNIDFLKKHNVFLKTIITKIIEINKSTYDVFIDISNYNSPSISFNELLNTTHNFISSIERIKICLIRKFPHDIIINILNVEPFVILYKHLFLCINNDVEPFCVYRPINRILLNPENVEHKTTEILLNSENVEHKNFPSPLARTPPTWGKNNIINEINKLEIYDKLVFYKNCLKITINIINNVYVPIEAFLDQKNRQTEDYNIFKNNFINELYNLEAPNEITFNKNCLKFILNKINTIVL